VLKPGDPVWIKDQNSHGTVVSQTPEPRSYIIQTNCGTLRRNHSALVNTPNSTPKSSHQHSCLHPLLPGWRKPF
jgi:hypothetical protein